MKGSRVTGFGFTFVIGWFLAVASTATAQSPQPVFGFPANSDTPVISYSETPEMLGSPDLTPRVQVFGDGWVLVHYPVYMQKAGDYELFLNQGELRQLLLAMTDVFDFDPQAVGQARKAIKEAREQRDGIAYYRSEGTLEQISVRLDSFQANPTSLARPVDLNLVWKNIASDAREFPGLTQIQKLYGARNSILAILQRDDLVKLPSAVDQEGAQ